MTTEQAYPGQNLPSVSGCPLCGAKMERMGALTVWTHPGDECPLAQIEIPLAAVPTWNRRAGPAYEAGVIRGWKLAFEAADTALERCCPTHTDEVEELSDAFYDAAKAPPIGSVPLPDEDDVYFWNDETRRRVCLGGAGHDVHLICTRIGGFEVWENMNREGGKPERCIAGGGYGGASSIEIGGILVWNADGEEVQ